MKRSYLLALLILILLGNTESRAQCSPALMADSAQWVTDGLVYAIAKRSNTLYLGGAFQYIGRPTGSFIGVNANGKVINQPSWPKIAGNVFCAVQDGLGGWIIGGLFNRAGDSVRKNLVQINASGQVTAWNPSPDSTVKCIAVSSGTVYIGGLFSNVGIPASPRSKLAALSLGTSVPTAWNPNVNNEVLTLAAGSSSVYIGGRFTNVGGIIRNYLAEVNNSTGVATSWYPSADNYVNVVLVKNSKVYVGGNFSTIGGSTRNKLAAIDKTSGLATTWNPNINGEVKSVALFANLLYIGGSFSTAGGVTRQRVAAIDTATGVPTTWAPVVNGTVNTIATDGTTVYVGGIFTLVNTIAMPRFAKISATTGTLTANQVIVPDATSSYPVNVAVISGTNVYIGGYIYSLGGLRRGYFAALDAVADTVLPLTVSVDDNILAMAVNGSNLLLGGEFSTVNGSSRYRLAAIDSTGSVLPWDPFSTAVSGISVKSLVVSGTDVFVGGNFNVAGHINVARINLTSGAFDSWSTSFDNNVNTMAISSGNLFVGRGAGTVTPPPYMRSYNLSTLAPLSTIATSSDVYATQSTGSYVFAGGNFTTVGGSSPAYLFRIDAATGLSTTWNALVTSVVSSLATSGSYLFVGGSFSTVGGVAHRGIAAVNMISAVATSWSPILRDVTVLADNAGTVGYTATAGNELWISGNFSHVDGHILNRLARFKLNGAPGAVTIAAVGGDSVCAGASKTFNVTSTSGVLAYQWRVNGVNTGTSSTYTYVPSGGDVVTCKMFVDACVSIDSSLSNAITITVRPSTTSLYSVTKSADTVCAGDSVSFVAHGIHGLHYQWKKNGVNVGTDDSTYRYPPLATDSVKCVVTAPTGPCYIANPFTSASLGVIVRADTIPVVTITGDSDLCAGQTTTMTLTSNVTAATYRWFVNATAPVGATSTTYSYTPANGDILKCVLTAPTVGCYSPRRDTSNIISMAVSPNVAPTTFISSSVTSVCAGKPITTTCTTNILTATYQWQVNGANTGTASNYSYAPVNGDVIRCIVTKPAGSCYTQNKDTSNEMTMTVTPLTMPIIVVNGPGAIDAGHPANLTATVVDAGTLYLITWYRNGVVFNTSSVPNTTYAKNTAPIDTITAKIISLSSGCYDTAYSNTIYVYLTTGIEDVQEDASIKIFPNPFSDQVVITGLSEGGSIQVFDVLGRKITEALHSSGIEMRVAVPVTTSGIYLFRLYDKEGILIRNYPLLKQ